MYGGKKTQNDTILVMGVPYIWETPNTHSCGTGSGLQLPSHQKEDQAMHGCLGTMLLPACDE